MLVHIILLALATAFVILFISKTGIRDRIVERAPELISKMFGCDFCLSFWTALIIAVIAWIFSPNLTFIVILYPVFSAPLTRFIL